jgi:hypothetical protein
VFSPDRKLRSSVPRPDRMENGYPECQVILPLMAHPVSSHSSTTIFLTLRGDPAALELLVCDWKSQDAKFCWKPNGPESPQKIRNNNRGRSQQGNMICNQKRKELFAFGKCRTVSERRNRAVDAVAQVPDGLMTVFVSSWRWLLGKRGSAKQLTDEDLALRLVRLHQS